MRFVKVYSENIMNNSMLEDDEGWYHEGHPSIKNIAKLIYNTQESKLHDLGAQNEMVNITRNENKELEIMSKRKLKSKLIWNGNRGSQQGWRRKIKEGNSKPYSMGKGKGKARACLGDGSVCIQKNKKMRTVKTTKQNDESDQL